MSPSSLSLVAATLTLPFIKVNTFWCALPIFLVANIELLALIGCVFVNRPTQALKRNGVYSVCKKTP